MTPKCDTCELFITKCKYIEQSKKEDISCALLSELLELWHNDDELMKYPIPLMYEAEIIVPTYGCFIGRYEGKYPEVIKLLREKHDIDLTEIEAILSKENYKSIFQQQMYSEARHKDWNYDRLWADIKILAEAINTVHEVARRYRNA